MWCRICAAIRAAFFDPLGDLSDVWITADILGNETQLSHPGARVRVNVRERGKTVYATVSKDPPLFDPASRTLKLRLEAQNPDLILRPDMFVDLEFSVPTPPGVSIPQQAVLDSGMQKVVYVETSEGVFERRKVTLGTAYGDYITVTSGLKAGERVVISGNFLIDSESRMRSSLLPFSTTAHGTNHSAANTGTASFFGPLQQAQQDPARYGDAGVEVANPAQVLGAPRGAYA